MPCCPNCGRSRFVLRALSRKAIALWMTLPLAFYFGIGLWFRLTAIKPQKDLSKIPTVREAQKAFR